MLSKCYVANLSVSSWTDNSLFLFNLPLYNMSPTEVYKRLRIPAYVLLLLLYIGWTNFPHVLRYGWPWKLYFPAHTIILLSSLFINFHYLINRYFRQERYAAYFVRLFLLYLIGVLSIYLVIRALSSVPSSGYSPLYNEPAYRIYIGSIFSLSIEFFMISMAKMTLEWYKKYETARKKQFEHMKEELRLLRAQLDPHFMFNTLNNIYLLVLNAAPEASGSILLLSELLNYILYESKEEEVSIEKEWEFIESYISLQQLRLENALQIVVEKKGEMKGRIPPLILFNFIENAFKHADGLFEAGTQRVHIFISVSVSENQLSLIVRNAFKARHNEHSSPAGIGINNTIKRLSLIYPDNYSLTIKDDNQLYSVELKIPSHVYTVPHY
ncbi:MAG: sensor histidine kinase [Bacteroidota bacterium]